MGEPMKKAGEIDEENSGLQTGREMQQERE